MFQVEMFEMKVMNLICYFPSIIAVIFVLTFVSKRTGLMQYFRL